MNKRFVLGVILVAITAVFGHAGEGRLSLPDGYAGPAWSVGFETGGPIEFMSGGPALFLLRPGLYGGPLILYPEVADDSASERSPMNFLVGGKVEVFVPALSRGIYATSVALSLVADPVSGALRADTEIVANALLFSSVNAAIGPVLTVVSNPAAGFSLLPGFTFALKEGEPYQKEALVDLDRRGVSLGGYWQGIWMNVNDTWIVVDGRPHFMARPEIAVHLAFLPFLEIGAGLGYQFVVGQAGTAIPLTGLSSPTLTVQVRSGHRLSPTRSYNESMI